MTSRHRGDGPAAALWMLMSDELVGAADVAGLDRSKSGARVQDSARNGPTTITIAPHYPKTQRGHLRRNIRYRRSTLNVRPHTRISRLFSTKPRIMPRISIIVEVSIENTRTTSPAARAVT